MTGFTIPAYVLIAINPSFKKVDENVKIFIYLFYISINMKLKQHIKNPSTLSALHAFSTRISNYL